MSPKLQNYLNKLEAKVERALNQVAHIVLDASGELVPVDTSNLWSGQRSQNKIYDGVGARVRQEPGTYGFNTVMIVGYTASYAVDVHENPYRLHGIAFNKEYKDKINAGLEHERRPQETNQFLKRPLRDPKVRQRANQAIRQEMSK